jgi:hypothetical protein
MLLLNPRCLIAVPLFLTWTTFLAAAQQSLPRFTEEREAAALFFVKKQLPELVPFLDELKKASPGRYEQEIGRIFLTTEMLADLRDNQRRHDLEVKIWKTENKAYLLVARLATLSEAERKKYEGQLMEFAKELADLDILSLKLKSEQLSQELADVNAELAKSRANPEKLAKERYEALLEKLKKAKN